MKRLSTGPLVARVAVALSAALIATTGSAPSATLAADTRVTFSGPAYESPGGLVPTIVTVWDPPAGYTVSLDARGIDGATVTCAGETWVNPVRNTVSRQCYVQLPMTPGFYLLAGRARMTKSGQADIVVDGVASRAIEAKGYPSPAPMTIEHAQLIERCWNETGDVWLTFDDSMSDRKLPIVLDILRRNDVRARFFLTGKWRNEHPDSVPLIGREGHLVANHTFGHVALSNASDETVLTQIDKGLAATTSPKLLRPPYGAGALTTRLEDLARQRSYELCRWTVDTNDWRGDPPAVLIERVVHGDFRTPPIRAGGVILMHGHGEYMVDSLQGIIDAVRAEGYDFDRLGDPLVEPRRRPDNSISLDQLGTYKGDNVYSATPIRKQTVRRTGVARRATYEYFVRVENDGDPGDSLVIRAESFGSARMAVSYVLNGADVTPAVTGIGHWISNTPYGRVATLVVRVRVGARAPVGSKRVVLVRTFSADDNTAVDVVRATAKR